MKQNYQLQEVVFVLERNEPLIEEYFQILCKCYQEDLKVSQYNPSYKSIISDNNAHSIIATHNNTVIGGAILYIRQLESPSYRLPLEKDTDINLNILYPNSNIELIGEISKVAIRPEYRDRRITFEIYRIIAAKSLNLGCTHLYFVTYIAMSKNTKFVLNAIGVYNHYRVESIKIPKAEIYEGLELSLFFVNITRYDSKRLLKSHFSDVIEKLLECNKPESKKHASGTMALQAWLIYLFLFISISISSHASQNKQYAMSALESVIENEMDDTSTEGIHTIDDLLDDKLRITFAIKFTGYITNYHSWNTANPQTISVAVFGKFNDKQHQMYKEFHGAEILGGGIKVNIFVNPDKELLSKMNIIYVTRYYKNDPETVLENASNALTIIDMPYIKSKNTVVKFFKFRDNVRFLINNKLATKNNILFNAKLLEQGTPRL